VLIATGRKRLIRSSVAEGKQAVTRVGSKVYWLSTDPAGVDYFDAVSGKVNRIKLPVVMAQQKLHYIQVASDGTIVTTSSGGFAILPPGSQSFRFFPMRTLGIPGITNASMMTFAVISPDGHYWIGIEGSGVFCFDRQIALKHAYQQVYLTGSRRQYNLKRPVCCAFDEAGNVFVGTDGSGIIKINPSIRKFNALNPTDISGINLENSFITALYKSDCGTLYFSTLHSGLVVYNPKKGLRKHIRRILNTDATIPEITFIHPWPDQQLLIGTKQGLFIYNDLQIREAPFSNPQEHFSHIVQSDSGTWLLGGAHGIYLLKNNRLTRVDSGPIDQISLLFRIDSQSFLMAEKGDKVYLMRSGSEKPGFTPLEIPADLLPPKPSFNGVAKSGPDYFIGTNFGLLKFNSQLKFQGQYGVNEGISDPYIYSMVADRSGKLWMGTNRGLSCFTPATGTFRNFTTDDGLQSMEFNTNSCFITPSGEMLFGGVDGINHFFPEEVQINTHLPSIQLSGVMVFDQRISHDSLLLNRKNRFHFHQNTLSFIVTATEYTRPDNNRIKVWLHGKTHIASSPGPDGMVRYPSLTYGDYTLFTAASNSDGVWTGPVQLLNFTIDPPYYLRGWFIGLMTGLALILLSVSYYLIYLNNLRRKTKALEHLRAIEEVRINIARDIHDDMGSELTQITLMAEQLVKNIPAESDRERDRASRLAAKSRHLIRSMGEIVWVTNPGNDTLESLLGFIRRMLNAIREETPIAMVIRFPEVVPAVNVASSARRKISLLVKEAVNNAIKHSGGDQIEVAFFLDKSCTFELSVSDNGKGMQPKEEYLSGNGMRHLKQYADELSMELTISSPLEGGAKIQVSGSLLHPSFSGNNKKKVSKQSNP
jgi:two-component sensor histidine kinase